jgi:putative peptidoglycan lipid II flippase
VAKKGVTGAYVVAAGIFLSRIAGLVRERVFAYYFGNSDAGDAFKAALRIPNFLQNLFGEGVLSGSFIPVYAALLAQKDELTASRLASVIASLLSLITAVLVLIGILATPIFIQLIAPGFTGEKQQLTILLVRLLFPGMGLLVLSAWSLGILNSHRRFFLSYAAPVLWNAAQIACLLWFGRQSSQEQLTIKLAVAVVIGSLLQFAVQLPLAYRLVNGLRPALDFQLTAVRQVLTNFLPVVTARGVGQISAYLDNVIASLLPRGAVSALSYAQIIYTLPVSLFGMAVSAAELPDMAAIVGEQTAVAAKLRQKIDASLQRIAFFVIPSMIAFLALGDVVVATLYQTGNFDRRATIYVWTILAAAAVGLLAATMGRLYSSTFYALQDTKTPLRYALGRVIVATLLGYFAAVLLPSYLGWSAERGTPALALASALAGWGEFILLRRRLNQQIGPTGLAYRDAGKLWLAALIAALIAIAIKLLLGARHPLILGVLVLGSYGTGYLMITWRLGVAEARQLAARVLGRLA